MVQTRRRTEGAPSERIRVKVNLRSRLSESSFVRSSCCSSLAVEAEGAIAFTSSGVRVFGTAVYSGSSVDKGARCGDDAGENVCATFL
jgi:hypothetical protein